MSMVSPYTRRLAYQQALEDFPDHIDEDDERRRRRREVEQQVVERAAAEAGEMMHKALNVAPLKLPQRQPEDEINWGAEVASALSNVAGAYLAKRKETPPASPVSTGEANIKRIGVSGTAPSEEERIGSIGTTRAETLDERLRRIGMSGVRVPFFGRGGTLRRGVGIVGEDGPELIINRDGKTVVVPLIPYMQEALGREMSPAAAQPASPVMQGNNREPQVGYTELAPDDVTRPRRTAPPPPLAEYTPPSVAFNPKPKAAPAPGLEEAEARLVQERLSQYPELGEVPAGANRVSVPGAAEALTRADDFRPAFDESAASMSRARVADVPGHYERQITFDRTHPERDRNGRLKSAAINAGLSFLSEVGRTGSLARGIGAAGAGAVAGAVVPSLDERIRQQGRVTGYQQKLSEARAFEKAGLDADARRAQTEHVRETTDYSRTVKREAETARQKSRRQRDVLALLGRLKGQRLDPVRHKRVLEAYEREFGYPLDVDGWNGQKSNLIVRGLIDEDNPQIKNDYLINPVTGERQLLGRGGYVTPVGESGMTAKQEADTRFSEERLGLQKRLAESSIRRMDTQVRVMERDLAGMSPAAAREFGVMSRGLPEAIRSKRAELERLRKAVLEYRVDDVKGNQQIEALSADIDALEQQFEAARSSALSGGGGGRSRGGAAPQKYTEADVRARARAAGKNEDAAVEAARKRGLLKE